VEASGSRTLWLGATTYASPRAGLVLWFSAEQPVSSVAGAPFDAGRRIRFGITRQFPLHF